MLLKVRHSKYNCKEYGPIVLELFLFVNPNRICLCKDSAGKLSHITFVIINNLRWFAFIRLNIEHLVT